MIRRLMRRKKSESGFTLIELLVVILVIGILSSIAVPVFLNQRKAAIDASLKSDLKNAATAYSTWRADPTNTNSVFRTKIVGNNLSASLLGPNAYVSPSDPGRTNLVEVEAYPDVTMSEGNVIEMLVRTSLTDPSWHIPHREGEFCMRASNPASNYDYIGDSGMGRVNFHRNLFFDSELGGIVEMDDIVSALNEGKHASCYWYGEAWLGATTG